VSLELRKGLSSTLPGGEADVRAALWASQFRNDCSRLLLFEDDMSGCGLGFTSALIENLLLYAVAQNRVLIEVPVNSSWHNVRGHMPFNEGRKPALSPRWCDDGPATHQCYYSRLTHCEVPPIHTHTAPHLGHGASIRNNNRINGEARALRFKLTWFFKTPGTGVFARAARREAARFLSCGGLARGCAASASA
jgi:hypothetical protein